MIARLASSALAGAVLLREAARTARRWQTYAVRTSFSAVLMGVVLFGIWFATEAPTDFVDHADLAWLGRGMFYAVAVIQVMLAFCFAPLLVARAIIEERDDHTIELLLMTRLTPRQILAGKVLSRILLLTTVIIGALPVLALIVSLGGVSVKEVVAVTLHAITAAVVLGGLGGFFALFTRSPMIATVAALFYTLPTFVVAPTIYAMMVADPYAMAHLSPLYGSSSNDWWSLLPALGFIPVLWMILRIGAPLFALRLSGARLGRMFRGDLWKGTAMTWLVLIVAVHTFSGLPAGMFGAWFFQFSEPTHIVGKVLQGLSVAAVWTWFVGAITLATWVYLRVTMDMVMVLDGYVHHGEARGERRGVVRVSGNPVAWREARPRAWRLAFPGVVGWFVVMLVVLQTGLWVIPGGLLTLGVVNGIAALMLTAWFATATIERERHDGTLELLLVTTLPSWRIVLGKLTGVVLPTVPVLLVSFPMIALGVPHLQMFGLFGDADLWEGLLHGVAICLWLVPVWLLVMTGAMTIAVFVKKSRAAYGINMGIAVAALVVPPLMYALFPRRPFVRVPARVLVPVVSADAPAWQVLLSMAGITAAALVILVALSIRLRRWGLRHG